MNWRSNYKLPFLSFIIFFILLFFLIGEQLPSLPLYVFGPATDHQDKIHILDLAQSDAFHRPVAYLIFALISWSLLKFLSWSIVWIITGSLWTFDQVFVKLGEPGKYFSFSLDLTLSTEKIIHSVIAFLGWGVLAMAPYFLYRWIDKKWGGKGIKKSVLILFFINLFLFGFFALQIYVLHHSYRGLHLGEEQSSSANDQRNIMCYKGNANNPPDCPK